MTVNKHFWVSAFNKGDTYVIRYHPVVGCGDIYAGGIDVDIVKVLSQTITTKLQQVLDIELDEPRVYHCSIDGAVAEYYVDSDLIDWDTLTLELDDLDPELSDLHIDYVEFN